MTSDRLTTLLGIAIGALHQYSAVGFLPQDVTGLVQTAATLAIMTFGYFCNKPQIGVVAK